MQSGQGFRIEPSFRYFHLIFGHQTPGQTDRVLAADERVEGRAVEVGQRVQEVFRHARPL